MCRLQLWIKQGNCYYTFNRASPLGTLATNWPVVPALDDEECGAVSGMRIGRGN
jgi:hypothetical protein